jgi:PAS domain S-box-containing protein
MKKIIIIDDKPENLYLLQAVLDDNVFKTVSARNGAEALGLIRVDKPDLIISDILMPVMDGFALCRECKKDETLKDIPFIFYTATYTDPKDEQYALEQGADLFILKPKEPDELLQIINDFLKNSGKTKSKAKEITLKPEVVVLKEYNEVLIRKLEDKMVQSERTEKELRDYTSKLEKEISERKRIESSLIESQALFKALAEGSPVGIFKTTVDGETTYVNPKWCELSGVIPTEAMGQGWLKAVHPEDRKLLSAKWADESQTGQVSMAEYRFLKPDKSIVWVLGYAVPEFVDGSIVGYVGTIIDISKRKIAQEALFNSQHLLTNALKLAKMGAWEYDVLADTFTFNDQFYQIYRTSAEKEGGYKMSSADYVRKFVYPDDVTTAGMAIRKSLETLDPDYSPEMEHRISFPNGEIGFVNVRLSIIKDSTGRTIRTMGVNQDITEQKRIEAELIKAKEKAEESDLLKTAFLHNLSHEIRTPMNAIIGFTALLNEPGLDEQTKTAFIDTITQSSDQLLSIINDILEIANLDAGIIRVSRSKVEINPVIKSIYNQFLPKANLKGLRFNFTVPLPDQDAVILTDRTKLIQIISNLINNALKFTSHGMISFGYDLIANKLRFYVTDTGIGISEEHLDKIFDRFYQVDHRLERQFEGTGLGLSICKSYVSLLGGDIWVSSKPGAGSSFYFTLTLDKNEKQAVGLKAESSEKGLVFPETKTILVAEDIDSNFKLIEYFLKKSNASIIRAKNGKEAVVKVLSGVKIDLILMDIKMPEMDGYEATEIIHKAKPDIPIIAQSAYADDRSQIIEAGCSGFIAKPFDRQKLLTTVFEFIG